MHSSNIFMEAVSFICLDSQTNLNIHLIDFGESYVKR